MDGLVLGVGSGIAMADTIVTTEEMDRMLQWSTVSMEMTKLISMEYGRPAQQDLTDIHHRFRQTHQEETQRLRFVATMNTTQRDDT